MPAKRTKTNAEHRVPLYEEALQVIKLARNDSDLLFISPRGKPLSDASMATFMKREGYTARPHGMRATFRT
ncbi:MAG: tyrosine-type recombinase/integrase [Pseudomonadota bacterium]